MRFTTLCTSVALSYFHVILVYDFKALLPSFEYRRRGCSVVVYRFVAALDHSVGHAGERWFILAAGRLIRSGGSSHETLPYLSSLPEDLC